MTICAVPDDVVHVALEQRVGAQRGVDVVHQRDVGGVVQALALAEQADLGQHILDLLVAILAEVDLARLLVHRVVAGAEVRLPLLVGDGILARETGDDLVDLRVQIGCCRPVGPEMISGVRASSIRMESTSSTMA